MTHLELFRSFRTINKPVRNNLLSYLALSSNPQSKFEVIYDLLLQRAEAPTQAECDLHISSHETKIFKRRFDEMQSNNLAYRIALKENPTVQDLIEFSQSFEKLRFSLLFPIKHYVMNHLELIKNYTGFVPFGHEVIKYYNNNFPEMAVKNNYPTYADHVQLRELSIHLAAYNGTSVIYVNNDMYLQGKTL
jgi:hypothetical protein